MLILSRKAEESIIINENITVKIVSIENALLLHAKEFSEEHAVKITQKISLLKTLAKLRRLCRRKRDYVVIGRVYEKIHRMVSERR